MNHSCLLRRLIAVCIFALLSVACASAFEGKVAMTMTTGKKMYPVTYYIKGSHMRTEMVMSEDKKGNKLTAVSLYDMSAKEMLILMTEQKMYMAIGIPDPDTAKDGKTTQSFDFKPTGRKEMIAGYSTEEYAGISEGNPTEMWVTKELGQFVMANQGKPGRKSQSAQWEMFMREGKFFPLRVIQRAKSGNAEQFRTEVTNVEKMTVPESMFVPPEDFTRLEMPKVGNMLKGLIPGR